MFGEFIQCNKHGGEGMRHDEKYGYWCELCELGYPRSEGQPNTGSHPDAAKAEPYFDDTLPEERALRLKHLQDRSAGKA